MNKTTVLYHDDADGFASAFAIWCTNRFSANYIPVQYSQPVPEIPEGTENLYIVDFSYSRDICEELAGRFKEILILDHHKTAEKELEGLPYAVFIKDLSGVGITWYRTHPEGGIMPLMLQYVQDRDLWKFELPDSALINLYIGSLPHDFEEWNRVCFGKEFLKKAKAVGTAIKNFRDGQMEGAFRDTRIMRLRLDGGTFEVPVVNCSANISEVGNALCKLYPDAPFSASYCDRKDIRSWSLRSIGDFDVSAIAKIFNGGGHKNAAGFSTDLGWPQYTPDEFIAAFEEALSK